MPGNVSRGYHITLKMHVAEYLEKLQEEMGVTVSNVIATVLMERKKEEIIKERLRKGGNDSCK